MTTNDVRKLNFTHVSLADDDDKNAMAWLLIGVLITCALAALLAWSEHRNRKPIEQKTSIESEWVVSCSLVKSAMDCMYDLRVMKANGVEIK